MTAIEVTGTIDEHRQLRLDTELRISGPKRVRVIVLYPLDHDWDEAEWLRAAARNPAFDYLKEAAEDIYSVTDGKPFHDEVCRELGMLSPAMQAEVAERLGKLFGLR